MLQIIQVSPSTIEATDKVKIDIPAIAYVGIEDGEIVGSGGLAWSQDGRCWVWLRVAKPKAQYALPLMKQTRKLMAKARQFGDTDVFTPRDTEFKTSEKLLTVLGFKLFAMENDIEVWRYVRV